MEEVTTVAHAAIQKLENIQTLIARQKKEWGEILTGLETKNKFSLMTPENEDVLLAFEESSLLVRLFLKNMRPFSIHIVTPLKEQVALCRAPIRWIHPEISVYSSSEQLIGTVKQKLTLANRVFEVLDSSGQFFSSI